MTGVTRPRGPLPARVYWTRRLLVTLVALALVFGVARLLGGGSDGEPEARTVGGSPTSSTTTPTPTPTPTPASAGSSGATTPPAQPTGACAGDDVVAVPSVQQPAYAANPILMTITLRTRTSPACTWTVSADALVVKVTRPTTSSTGLKGTDSVWTTQECRGAVAKQVLVLRHDTPNRVTVVWNGRRSDSTCSDAPTWAGTGYYHVAAAAFGGNPTQAGFRLGIAPRATITATPTPTPTATGGSSATPRAGGSAGPSGSASDAPRATAGATSQASGSPSASRAPAAGGSAR